MLTHLGMGDDNMLSFGLLGGRHMSEDDITIALKNPEIFAEANHVLKECKERVEKLLTEKRAAMEAVRDALVERDEISGDEFREILYGVGAITDRPKTLRPIPIAPAWVPAQAQGQGMVWGTPPPGADGGGSGGNGSGGAGAADQADGGGRTQDPGARDTDPRNGA